MKASRVRYGLNRGFRWEIARGILRGLLFTALLVGLAAPAPQPVKAASIPTFNIVQVVKDDKVTIRTYNFPAGQLFTVRMGAYGTKAVGGEIVATTNSGAGGSFEETYSIPANLKGSYRIAIRLESGAGYFAYNWFVNNFEAAPAPGYTGIPTFSIVSVARDDKVTIRTNNFPAGQLFTVRMGEYGTKGIDGVVVDTTNSGAGGAFETSYSIPDSLKGSDRIAIRLESGAGHYAYNWFYNNTTGGAVTSPTPGYTGIPTFRIVSVVRDDKITIRANNFPAGQSFTVRMGEYGTKGIDGVVVDTTNSGAGGAFETSYSIPDSLKGSYRIAIRLESGAGHYAYNWFYNNTTGGAEPPPTSGYTGIPTFSIVSVARDAKVTIRTNNFPAGQSFTVRMGAYGTKGIGGVVVDTTNSGAGGAFETSYSIPDSLKGSYRIAVRFESGAGYYAYNWFYNNTTD